MPKSERSKVEVEGFEAKYYDQMMWILTLGQYQRLIRRAAKDTGVKLGDHVLEFGCGTGIAAVEFAKLIGNGGRYVGLDVSEIMLEKARKKCRDFNNFKFLNMRIEEHLPFENEFDVGFMSFVFHGLEMPDRIAVLRNAFKALKDGGRMCIFDYAHFDVEKSPFPVKYFILNIECPLAAEFIALDLKDLFESVGFTDYTEKLYAKGYLRLACGSKR